MANVLQMIRLSRFKLKDFRQVGNRSRGMYKVYLKLMKRNQKISTYNQLDSYTLISRPILPKAHMVAEILINLLRLQQPHVKNLRLHASSTWQWQIRFESQFQMLPHALQIGHVQHGKVQTTDR